MEKCFRSSQPSQPHQNAKTIKGHKSDICENKNRKTLQIKSRKQNHYHKHHSDDNDSHDLSTTEDSVFSDHHHDNRHHHSHWSKRKQSHRSLSTSTTSITSSSSSSSSSSSTSSSPSTSSLSSSFSSSTTSSSSSSFSSDTDSESSHPRSKPQHSHSCTDISSKKKYFDEEDDTAPLIGEGEHLTQKPKQERVRSSQCVPSHGGHKITRGDGSVRKAKSMESLARPKEKEAQDETEQERRKNEARKNLVKEKIKFSAFLNEITRQVLSPMRLTTLGVSNAQRSSSPAQVSFRSKKSENNPEKKQQQTNLPRSADSASSGRHSRSSRRSKRSNSHHRHYSHRSADSPDHKPRSCPDTGCFKRQHSWSYRHRSCSPSDKQHHNHHQEHHCNHHGHDSPSYQRDHQHKYEHYRSPTCYQDDHHKISHYHKKHHYHYSENHQSTPHHHNKPNAPAHHNSQCPAHQHGSCHTSHHCDNGNNHQSHSSHSNERPTTPHHHRHHNDPGDYCTDSYDQHHHGDHHSQHHNPNNHHCKHHNHGHHRNVPHHQHREHHHQREHHYGGHYHHEDHHDNPYYHGNHQSESYHHHGDHQDPHHEPHPHHCKLNHLNEHHHHGDHHSESHHHDGDHHTDPKNHHGDHHSESHHHHGEHHAGHQQYHEDHYSPHIGPKSHQIQSKTNQGHTGHVYHGQSLDKDLESSKDSTRNDSTASQDEDQTSFTDSLCKENAHDIGRLMILQEQNEGLQQTLLKTAVKVECLGEEFMSSRKCLEAELQRTRMELSNLTERFKRLHDNCSSTQQTNSLLQQKLHLVAQNMEGERERLNKRISALTETLADTKFANSMETCNATSKHKSNHHFHSEDVINQVVLPITPPPAQFMDYAKDKAAGQEQSLGSVPEEEESDWSEIGEETPRFILTGLNRGQAWRHTESEVDKDSGSGGEEIVRPHSPRPLTIPHLHFNVHNEMSPFTQTNLSNIGICEGSYKITTNPKLGSAILVRSASLEEIPLARHSMQKELRGTEAMMDLHHPCANEDYNEIIHHLGTSNNRDTVNGWQIDSSVSEMDRAMSGLQSAERILNHIISETQQSQQMGEARAEMHGWTGGIPDEVLKGERTKL